MPTLFSKFYENMFGAAQMWAVFSDDHRFISWPATEPAVAKVEKYFALTPEPAAASIAEVARLVKLDLPAMRGRMRARRFTHPPVCSSTGRGLRPRDNGQPFLVVYFFYKGQAYVQQLSDAFFGD